MDMIRWNMLAQLPSPRRSSPPQDFEVEMERVRELDLREPTREGMPNFLSSASGVTRAGEYFHVIADDGLHLGVFQAGSKEPGSLLKLFDRPDLPLDEKERKALKPDLEASTIVTRGDQRLLLAVGSGSTERRNTGVLVPLESDGKPGPPQEFDLTPLYSELRQRYPDLNIEGMAPVGERLRLLQRGNSDPVINGVIDLDLNRALEKMEQGKALTADLIVATREADLGTVPDSQVPWTFTDLAPLQDGRSVFTAAAEDTDNPYEDGEVLGSAVGILEADGSVSAIYRLQNQVKVEGVDVDGDQATLVTDADDPHRPGQMFRIRLP